MKMGGGTEIVTLGFAESALLLRILERELELHSRLPGANARFSVFETGTKDEPQEPF